MAACFLAVEDACSLKWMMETFKKHNPEWPSIKVVLTDKDIVERETVKVCLPNASLAICLFHMLRSVRREVTIDKMRITAGQRLLCLELFQRMAHSSSQSAYYEAYNQLKKDAPKSVLHYFDVNWHPIRDQWVLGLKFGCGSFLNSTNNRLESINGKLKQVISRKTGFTVFLDQFFIIINALRTERDHKAAVSFQKTRIHVYSSGSAESSYAKLLTPYAFRFVLKQMTLIDKVQEILPSEDDYVTNSTNEGQIVVSLRDCSCIFRRSMGLPCRHMLSLAKKLEKPLFNELLCDKRWTLDYYRQVHRVFDTAPDEPTSYVTSTEASASHVKKMTQHEKFRKASLIASQLASVTSEASNVHFERRIEVLKDLIDYWKEGIEVSVVEVEGKKFTLGTEIN